MSSSFGARLAAAMRSRTASQTEIADAVGVTQPAVSSWLSGDRNIDRSHIPGLARFLGVSAEWLEFGRGEGPDTEEARTSYRRAGVWGWRPEPADRARDFGNANVWSFTPSVETLTRESIQNVLDAKRATTVEVTYRITRLKDEGLEAFKDALLWDDLHAHLGASAIGESKLAQQLRFGLEQIEESGELLLLLIEDRGTTGLVGGEFGEGNFAALTRNNLDSSKASATAGGAFGLGKAVFWRTSLISTVLFHSNLAAAVEDGRQHGRIIGRAELPWHSLGGRNYAGPGWFGRGVEDRAESFWGASVLAHDLKVAGRDAAPGTSVLVVGFHDPTSDRTLTTRELASQIETAAARHFWPALADGRLSVGVETAENDRATSSVQVDAERLEPGYVDALRRQSDGMAADALLDPADVVVRPVALNVPARRDGTQRAVSHEAVLVVRRAEEDDESANELALFRGTGMVVKYVSLSGLRVGAFPVHAVALCGTAVGREQDDLAAEIFLRTAEPPAHNDWTPTPDLRAAYHRGYGTGIADFIRDLKSTVAELVTPAVREHEEGPQSLSELFRVGAAVGPSDRPRIADAKASVDAEGRWTVEAKIRNRPREHRWRVRPVVVFSAETGPGTPVPWAEFEAFGGAEVARHDGTANRSVAIPTGVREVLFRGVAAPDHYPVPARRSSIELDLRRIERVDENGDD